MDEPLSSAGPTRATSTALHCDSLRCEARLQPRFEVKICAPRREGAVDIVSTIDGTAFRPGSRSWGIILSVPSLQAGATLLGSGCRAQACPMCGPTSGRAVLTPLVPWQSAAAQKTRVKKLILAVNGLCDAPLSRYGHQDGRARGLHGSRSGRCPLSFTGQHGARAVRKRVPLGR